MRVGLLSDVHANLPALEAVLEDLPEVDEIVCAGDVVGYNAWPSESLDLVREVAEVTVQGNHDRTVPTPQRFSGNPMAAAGLQHAKQELSDEQQEWLSELPMRATFANDRYLVVHSHPDPDEAPRYVDSDEFAQLEPYLDDYDGLVLGHTHVQHKEIVDGRAVINPGSVGQPRDEDHRAAYAILDTETNSVELRRIEYDVVRAQQAVHEADLPSSTAYRLGHGK